MSLIYPGSGLESVKKGISLHDGAQLQKVLANWKLSPATFGYKISRGKWIPKPHLLYISQKVATGIAKGNARIIISVPPRHGKSQSCSIYMPAWVLEQFPEKNVILSSYGADLAIGFGRNVRDIFLDPENQGLLETKIRRDSAKVAAFLTNRDGAMYSVGLGGPITGRGADVLVIDDYIKEIKEALSPAYRDYVWNWFVTTAYTRLEPNGSVVIIATRWHSDDLIGRLLKNYPDEWDYIEIPAVAEEHDQFGRKPGEALFPERYPIERLYAIRKTLGSTFFQALYQQKPVDETAKIADGGWLKIVPYTHSLKKVVRVWDLAATEGGGDYTCGTKLGIQQGTNNVYILDVIREQLSPQQIEALVRKTAEADGLDVEVRIEKEPGSSGKNLVNHYEVNVLPEYRVGEVPTTKEKLVRAQPLLAAAEAGQVYLIEAEWNDTFIAEFDTFPGGQNDDQVDTTAAGYTVLTGKKHFSASWGRHKDNGDYKRNSKKLRQASFSMSAKSRGAGSYKRRSNRVTFGR